MADGYDRFDNEGGGGGSFVMGLLTGTVLGAGLGMLFAPKAGTELRSQVAEQAGNLANTASEGYRRASEAAGGWAEKGTRCLRQGARCGQQAAPTKRSATCARRPAATPATHGRRLGYSAELDSKRVRPIRCAGPRAQPSGTPGGSRRS